MRDSIKVFADELDRHLTQTGTGNHAWETESVMVVADELDLAMAELYVSLKELHIGAEDELNMRRKCLDVAANAMMIFSHYHPLTKHNRCGVARHTVPRQVAQET